MERRQPLQSERKGAVMALVLLIIIILAIAGVGLLELGLRSRTFASRTASDIEARCAADAGLVKAVFEMNEKLKVTPWDDSILPQATNEVLPNCGATFSYAVTGGLNGGYGVVSTGKSDRVTKQANCALQLWGPFDAALFVDTTLSLKEGTTVEWYNYDEGEKSLQIGTNSIEWGSIDLKNGVLVNGDVVVGFGGDPDTVIQAQWATITGDTYSMTQIYDLPTIGVPGYLDMLPSEGIIKNTTTLTTSGKYDGINLGPGEIITIDGPVALDITGDIILKNSAQLQIVDAAINPNASLTLYVGGNIDCRLGCAINNLAQDAKKLKIYGLDTCTNMDFKNSTDFYGAIYAPNTNVTFYNSGEAYGAVVANSFEQKNSATFHYDASLRDVSVNEEAVHFVIKQWSEE